MPALLSTTPCPVPVSFTHNFAPSVTREETTRNVDFTFDLQAAFKQAVPQRRRPRTHNNAIEVFEDDGIRSGDLFAIGIDEVLTLTSKNNDGRSRKDVPAPQRQDTRTAPPVRARNVPSSRRENVPCQGCVKRDNAEQGPSILLRKESRRRTIYVPSEDTTIMTIHPGSHQISLSQTELATQNLAHSRARTGRTKAREAPATASRRAPLLSALQNSQDSNLTRLDIHGQPTGKENVPPGSLHLKRKDWGMKNTGTNYIIRQRQPSLVAHKILSVPARPRIAPNARRNADGLDGRLSKPSGKGCTIRANLTQNSQWLSKKVPEKLAPPEIKVSRKLPITYAPLDEDISHPEMFEENWLNNQEIAITELINSLFKARSSALSDSVKRIVGLRHDLMQLYQQSSMLFLYKRLDASLIYGALRPSADRMVETSRSTNDVGTCRRFNELWVKTYSTEILRCAVEVIVGKAAPFSPGSAFSSSRSDARSVQVFIDACILHNEDTARPIDISSNAPSWSWRRTMQRCLMLILLLDRAKETNIMDDNLFQTTSEHKSSSAVLRALTSILLPHGGDLSRTLAHLDYHLTHEQHPLSEYDYTFGNLAVDLRDGVRLAHLVEILLDPSSRSAQKHDDPTILMLSSEPSTSLATDRFGGLSQHLKYPCQTKVCKVYNVRMVLNALSGWVGLTGMFQNIRPEDIVNGHREKTMSLLWGLIGTWGLEMLVDTTEVQNEIGRLNRRDAIGVKTDSDNEITGLGSSDRSGRLLQTWAQAVVRRHGLKVRNLSTCFADGKVFGCIVDEYRPFITSGGGVEGPATLGMKLQRIGCSPSFGSMVGDLARNGRLFGPDVTIAALAFLCSRLLGASKKGRVLAGLASECMKVVVTRNAVLGAAVTLQRAWRAHVTKRRLDAPPDFWVM